MKGWNSETKIVNLDEQEYELAWLQGYFWPEDNQGKDRSSWLWKRNFHEIRQRDLMLFSLGEIKGKKILDVGCGSAEYLRTVSKMGAKYVGGQDLSEDAIKRGRLKLKEDQIEGKLVIGDAAKLDFS